jgi:hypothetical protein
VYKRDKGLFARGFCILRCVHMYTSVYGSVYRKAKGWRIKSWIKGKGSEVFLSPGGRGIRVLPATTCYQGLFARVS